jgi:hypothetical protein
MQTASLREGDERCHFLMPLRVQFYEKSACNPHKHSVASAYGGWRRHLPARVARNSNAFPI